MTTWSDKDEPAVLLDNYRLQPTTGFAGGGCGCSVIRPLALMTDPKPTFGKRLKKHEDQHPWFWGILSGGLFSVGTFFVQTRGQFDPGWVLIALMSLIFGFAYAVFAATYVPKLRRRREAEAEALESLGPKGRTVDPFGPYNKPLQPTSFVGG